MYVCMYVYLHVPCHASDVLKWVWLVAGAHGGGAVVQVPYEYLGLARPGGKEVGLEGVNVQGTHGSHVLVGLAHDRI